MVPRPLGAARAMRSRTCADVVQPCLHKVLNESDECTRYFVAFYAVAPGLSTQWGLGTTNKHITSNRDMNTE